MEGEEGKVSKVSGVGQGLISLESKVSSFFKMLPIFSKTNLYCGNSLLV